MRGSYKLQATCYKPLFVSAENDMNNSLRYSLLSCLAFVCTLCRAQVDTTRVKTDSAAGLPQGAVFIPLYLDSAYDGNNNYRYDKTFPKFINPGLEFYEGVKLALDSLQQERA